MIRIIRMESGDQGTFGRLVLPNTFFYTGELPWRGNAPNISCIPEAAYEATYTWSPRFQRMLYLIHPVEGRSGIRKHPANLMGDVALGYRSQLNGCIALGERLGWLGGQKAVLLSSPAVRRFHELMGGKPFKLEVVHV